MTIRKYLKIPSEELPENKKTVRKLEHQQALERIQKDASEVRKLYESVMSVKKIAVLLQRSKILLKDI